MALIKCPECGKDVSDTAEYCVQCGFDLLVYKEDLRLDKEIEEEMIAYEKQIEKPKQITSLKEVHQYRNEESASTIILFATIGFFIAGLVLLQSAPPVGGFVLILSIVFLAAYINLKKKDQKLLREEQERIQSTIDNFDTDKQRKIELHRQLLIKQKEKKLDNLKARNNVQLEEIPTGIHCPMCQSTSFDKISTLNRAVSIELVGLASGKIGKQYKCKKCGHMW